MGDVQKNQDSVHFEYIEYTERGKCIPNLSVSQLSQMDTVCEGLVLLPQQPCMSLHNWVHWTEVLT